MLVLAENKNKNEKRTLLPLPSQPAGIDTEKKFNKGTRSVWISVVSILRLDEILRVVSFVRLGMGTESVLLMVLLVVLLR